MGYEPTAWEPVRGLKAPMVVDRVFRENSLAQGRIAWQQGEFDSGGEESEYASVD